MRLALLALAGLGVTGATANPAGSAPAAASAGSVGVGLGVDGDILLKNERIYNIDHVSEAYE